MPRIRTIGKCIEELRAVDPNTCITAWNIRNLILDGKISFWKSGNRNLVDVDQVEQYFDMAVASEKQNLCGNSAESMEQGFILPVVHRRKREEDTNGKKEKS